MSDLPDPDLDAVATVLRKAFAEAKQEQTGRVYRPAPRFRSPEIWLKAAARCQYLRADPRDLVDAAFAYCMVPGGPFPQHMACAAVDRWYREFLRIKGGELAPGETLYGRRIRIRLRDVALELPKLAAQCRKSVHQLLMDDKEVSLERFPACLRLWMFPDNLELRTRWEREAASELAVNPRLAQAIRDSGGKSF